MCNHSMSRIHSIQLGEYMLDIRSRQRARVRTKKSGKAATRRMAQVAETNGRAKRGRGPEREAETQPEYNAETRKYRGENQTHARQYDCAMQRAKPEC